MKHRLYKNCKLKKPNCKKKKKSLKVALQAKSVFPTFTWWNSEELGRDWYLDTRESILSTLSTTLSRQPVADGLQHLKIAIWNTQIQVSNKHLIFQEKLL